VKRDSIVRVKHLGRLVIKAGTQISRYSFDPQSIQHYSIDYVFILCNVDRRDNDRRLSRPKYSFDGIIDDRSAIEQRTKPRFACVALSNRISCQEPEASITAD
jgi:hypothetical protein